MRLFCFRWCALLLLLPGCEQPPVLDAEADDAAPEWTDTHQLAWEVVSSQPLATLITLDEDGHPQERTEIHEAQGDDRAGGVQ